MFRQFLAAVAWATGLARPAQSNIFRWANEAM